MKAWLVTDSDYEWNVAVIAETRSRAKLIAKNEFFDFNYTEWTDIKCRQVKSPIPIEGPQRILDTEESLWYGFRWNNESMDFFFPGWYNCWLREKRWAEYE